MPPCARPAPRLAGLVLLSTLALVLSACAGTDAGGARTYKVGFLLQLSGHGSVYAETTRAGQRAALTDVNKHNTAGIRFTPDVADAGDNAQDAATACNRLVLQDQVKAVIAFVTGPQLLGCNTVAGRLHIPVLSLSSGAGNICAPNLTSYGLVPNQQTLPVIDELLKRGKKRWYFFGADYSTPKATIAIAKPYLTAHGGTVVGESYEPSGTADFSQDISAIVKARPDVAFLNVTGNDDVTLQKQWAADPRTKHIARVDILLGEGGAHALGAAARGIWSSNAYFAAVPGSGNAAFKAAVKAAGLSQPPDINAYISYMQVQSLAAAVKKAGRDGPGVIKALRRTDIDGPVGTFRIRDTFSVQPVYLAQARADGGFTVRKKSAPIAPRRDCRL